MATCPACGPVGGSLSAHIALVHRKTSTPSGIGIAPTTEPKAKD